MTAGAGAISNAVVARIADDRTPLARILAHESAYWTAIAQVRQGHGCKLFANPAYPTRFDPNHAGEFTGAEGEGPAIVHAIVEYYRSLGVTPVAYVDVLSRPTDLERHLEAAGFAHMNEWDGDLMLFVGPDRERPSSVAEAAVAAVDAVDDDAGRRAWASLVEDEASPETVAKMEQMYAQQIGDPRVRAYLGRGPDGAPAARCQLFSSDGIGRVEAVRTLTAYRGAGLAAAVVRRAVYDSLALGHDLTYLFANPGGAGQRLYSRLGFRTLVPRAVRTYVYRPHA